ncbi:MAG: hypothetical protein E7266_06590 [Lachnospiraceae bacterium]|nr:hypothetical protein [Lachnospiraceae bacterium]
MNNAFGNIIGFILLAVMLFVVPVRIKSEERRITEKMYLYTELTQLCEQVKNTGVLTDYTYENLCRMTGNILSVYKVEIWSLNGDGSITVSDEITDCLENNGKFTFKQGDFIRIVIKAKDEVKAYCGGMVKYNEGG